MQVLHRRAMTRVPEVTEALRVCEVPDSIKEAEHLMQEDLKLKENLVNRIAEAELNIDRFFTVLNEQGVRENVEVGSGTSEYVSMADSLSGMLQDLKASQGQFDGFWTTHKARVDHMMRMCHFKKTAEEVCRSVVCLCGFVCLSVCPSPNNHPVILCLTLSVCCLYLWYLQSYLIRIDIIGLFRYHIDVCNFIRVYI